MNNVNVSVMEVSQPQWTNELVSFALKVMAELGCENWELSVLLCSDKTIKGLNAKYRNKDEATDVLSFELGAEETAPDGSLRYFPGDIVISLETLHENAGYFKISDDEELRRLLIHGILHLYGMDHKTNDANEPMIVKQENILDKFKQERIIPDMNAFCRKNK